jgi:hypothetical protein
LKAHWPAQVFAGRKRLHRESYTRSNVLNNNRINTNLFSVTGAAPQTRFNLVNTDRQSRFDARAERRWGNWGGFLEFPTPLLWLEADPVVCLGDECVLEEPAIIELWP